MRTKISSMRTGLIAGTAVFAVALIFIIQNAHAVSISFLGAHLRLSLAVALLLAAVVGALLMAAAGTARITQLRRIMRHDRRQPPPQVSGQGNRGPLRPGFPASTTMTAAGTHALARSGTQHPAAPHRMHVSDQGVIMGILAWIILGLAAGLLGNALIPGKRSQGLILTCVIGIAGALGGGWAATRLFHIHTLNGFFNLSTWLTAIAGSAVLLLAYHLVTGQASRRQAHR